jgi:hypothetical protein
MKNARKTKRQLMADIELLRARVAQLQAQSGGPGQGAEAREIVKEQEGFAHTLESTLSGRERQYRQMVEHSLGLICIHDFAGNLLYVNPAAAHSLEYPPDAWIGKNLRDFLAPKFRPLLEVSRKDGKILLFECRTRAIPDREGRPIGFQVIYRDITARRQSEEQLRQAKEAAEAADREKSEFLAIMSHELRTPLNVILGYVDLLLTDEQASLGEEQRGFVRRIGKNARGLIDLINGVLDFNRLEAGRMPVEATEVHAPEFLKEIEGETQGLRELSGLTYIWRVEDGIPPLLTDAGKLKVIIKNLLDNATKFTKAGSVTIAAAYQNGGVTISVTDTGIGIAPEQQTEIFEAFRKGDAQQPTARREGFGLGLHIVKRLLSLLEGTIEVESAVGRGSTFRVWLPLAPTAMANH